MNVKRIMIIAGKETMLIKLFEKKIQSSGIVPVYVQPDVNAVNAQWKDSDLITCYLEPGERMPVAVVQFLADKMTDDNKRLIIVGDKIDTDTLSGGIPAKFIYKVFQRPLDNDEYIRSVTEMYDKIESGEFKKSILVVDDDPSYLSLVREWLKDSYKVSIVTSGIQAIKWLGKNKADLILLDYEMPVTTGPQVLEMLRSDEDTKDIPVIFLTGKSDRESVVTVLAMKPDGYFLKNIEKAELLDRLNDFFALKNHKEN